MGRTRRCLTVLSASSCPTLTVRRCHSTLHVTSTTYTSKHLDRAVVSRCLGTLGTTGIRLRGAGNFALSVDNVARKCSASHNFHRPNKLRASTSFRHVHHRVTRNGPSIITTCGVLGRTTCTRTSTTDCPIRAVIHNNKIKRGCVGTTHNTAVTCRGTLH